MNKEKRSKFAALVRKYRKALKGKYNKRVAVNGNALYLAAEEMNLQHEDELRKH